MCNLAQYLQDRHGNLTIFQHKIYPPGITQPRLRDDFDKISCIPPGRPSEGVQGSWESFEHRAYTVIDDGIDAWSLVSSDVPQDGAAEAIEFDPQGLQQCDLCQGPGSCCIFFCKKAGVSFFFFLLNTFYCRRPSGRPLNPQEQRFPPRTCVSPFVKIHPVASTNSHKPVG